MFQKKEKDKCLTLLGKVLLLRILNKYGNWKEHTIPPLIFNQFGKPCLEICNFYFNISHAGNIVVCAYSDKEIGIDVEEIQPCDLNEYKRVLTPQEYDFLKLGTLKDFYRVWTQKEALMKVTGKGFYLEPQTMDLSEKYTKNSYITQVENSIYHVYTMNPWDGYILSVASAVHIPELYLQKIFL